MHLLQAAAALLLMLPHESKLLKIAQMNFRRNTARVLCQANELTPQSNAKQFGGFLLPDILAIDKFKSRRAAEELRD